VLTSKAACYSTNWVYYVQWRVSDVKITSQDLCHFQIWTRGIYIQINTLLSWFQSLSFDEQPSCNSIEIFFDSLYRTTVIFWNRIVCGIINVLPPHHYTHLNPLLITNDYSYIDSLFVNWHVNTQSCVFVMYINIYIYHRVFFPEISHFFTVVK